MKGAELTNVENLLEDHPFKKFNNMYYEEMDTHEG